MLSGAGLDSPTANAAPAELARRACNGDELALAAVQSAARALGIALSSVVNVLDLPTVVLGGHLAQVGELLAPEVAELLRRRVLAARWASPTVLVAPDDPAPGASGAALLALEQIV